MSSILDPPEQLFCLSYTSKLANASSGQRMVFFRADEIEAHIADVRAQGYRLDNITVHILRATSENWEKLAWREPMPGSVVRPGTDGVNVRLGGAEV